MRAAPQNSIGQLFKRLQAQLGNKIDDLYARANPDLVQREWAQGLFEFTTEEVARGVAACRGRKFAPTLGEFLHLCRPCLDPEMAWHEAQAGLAERRQGRDGTWSHPAVYRAACVMNGDLVHGQFRGHRNRWEHVLCAEFAKGFVESVPPVPPVLVSQARVSTMPESVRLALAKSGLVLARRLP